MDAGATIKIAAQHALEILLKQLLHDFSASRMVLVVYADRWGREAPNVSVLAIFSPPGFISLDRRTALERALQSIEHWLRKGFDAVEQFYEFSIGSHQSHGDRSTAWN